MGRVGVRRLAVVGVSVSLALLLWAPSAGALTFTQDPGADSSEGCVTATAVGDFNGDGNPDLAFTCSGNSTSSLSVLLGDGSGGFTEASGSPYVVGNGPVSVVVGDFNEDHVPDLAVASTNGTLTVLLGDGSGGFSSAPGPQVSVDGAVYSLAVGDFNGDGHEDLAMAVFPTFSGKEEGVVVLLGDGSGGFSPTSGSPISVGSTPTGIVAGDFNGDGHLDLATANDADPGSISVLLGDGSGAFSLAPGSPIASGDGHSWGVVTGDFNGDHKLDLAVANEGHSEPGLPDADPPGSVSILLGGGDGTFVAAPGSPVTPQQDVGYRFNPTSVATADFNGDGYLDLIADSRGALVGDGTGRFSLEQAPTAGAGLSVADFNRDGHPDFAGGSPSVQSGPVAWLDAPPATLSISSGPSGSVSDSTATFGFSVSDPDARLECQLDQGTWSSCASPQTYTNLPDGSHTLTVRAVGWPQGPTDSRSFFVDTNLPTAFGLISPADGAQSPVPQPTFSWDASSDSGSGIDHYELWIDGTKDGDVPLSACAGGRCSAQPAGALSDGTHRWRIRAVDAAGNIRDSLTFGVTIAAPPIAAIDAHPRVALTGSTVTFDASRSRDSNGAALTDYSWDPTGSGHFTSTGATPTFQHSYSTPGTYTATVHVTNAIGLTDTGSVAVTVDLTPPPGPVGISINNGDYATNDPHVQLNIVWPAYTTTTLISNDGGFGAAGGTQRLPVAPTVAWMLPSAASGRLPITVYLRFPDSDIPDTTFSDDIVLDTTTPTVENATLIPARTASDTAGNAPRLRTFTVRLRARDRLSGISAAQFSTAKKHRRRITVTLTSRTRRGILRLRRGVHVSMTYRPRYVRVRSAAGTWSKWHRIA